MTNVIKAWANNYTTIALEEGTPEVLEEMMAKGLGCTVEQLDNEVFNSWYNETAREL